MKQAATVLEQDHPPASPTINIKQHQMLVAKDLKR